MKYTFEGKEYDVPEYEGFPCCGNRINCEKISCGDCLLEQNEPNAKALFHYQKEWEAKPKEPEDKIEKVFEKIVSPSFTLLDIVKKLNEVIDKLNEKEW